MKRPLSAIQSAYEAGRRCPRSVKLIRSRCEKVKKHLAERAAKAQEDATAWKGDGQRWAALVLVARVCRLQIKSLDKVLDRLNELLLEAETSGGMPIDAVIQLGRDLGLENQMKEHWERKARAEYEPGSWQKMKRIKITRARRRRKANQ